MQTTIGGFAIAAKFRYRPCYPYTLPNLSAQHRYTFVLCANKFTISSIYMSRMKSQSPYCCWLTMINLQVNSSVLLLNCFWFDPVGTQKAESAVPRELQVKVCAFRDSSKGRTLF